jgi:shikimate kinase
VKLLLLHGAPGVGKLTVAQILAPTLGYKVLHNHLTFNAARALFELGDPNHISLHRRLRNVMLESLLGSQIPGVITTLAYFEPDSVDVIATFKRMCSESDASIVSVYLSCSEDELLRRVQNSERVQNGKLTSAKRLSALLRERSYRPIPGLDTVELDTTNASAKTVADRVLAELKRTGNV